MESLRPGGQERVELGKQSFNKQVEASWQSFKQRGWAVHFIDLTSLYLRFQIRAGRAFKAPLVDCELQKEDALGALLGERRISERSLGERVLSEFCAAAWKLSLARIGPYQCLPAMIPRAPLMGSFTGPSEQGDTPFGKDLRMNCRAGPAIAVSKTHLRARCDQVERRRQTAGSHSTYIYTQFARECTRSRFCGSIPFILCSLTRNRRPSVGSKLLGKKLAIGAVSLAGTVSLFDVGITKLKKGSGEDRARAKKGDLSAATQGIFLLGGFKERIGL
ncbi:hypothetical protein H6P81_021494 [Aristolochia fimbriata]|uniref:Uncharacterized protein n=1 Tax=Aristolochia fimbriata TaxID=158543 RepID=A0AAV7DSW1_ARIFI|nr:hypothetical protein H6P81_021494 [Aristolochia fimbriata]